MKIKNITDYLEKIAPLSFQESYDNAGLVTGDENNEIEKALICLDITEEIIDEAINDGFKLVISHHPLVFNALKKITGKDYVEKVLIKAIKNNIALYSAHTNLDNVLSGVNAILCEKLGIQNYTILQPKAGLLKKLVTFCPVDKADEVRNALFEAGAGHIGNYDSCSFNTKGKGSFKANEIAKPYVGEHNKLHFEEEERIETIFPFNKEYAVLSSLFAVHPYEEVAYDIYPIENKFKNVGAGMIGELENSMDEKEFLLKIKKYTGASCVRHSDFLGKKVKKIAVCGGSGSFLINAAISAGADVFITGEVGFHEFFKADQKIIIVDIGHYESEHFTKELIFAVLKEKFSTFALRISEINTNSINYL
ncbi:MAG: Nif3-like dinuclear metal center hexameric protein [Bacteroidales bacterium]|nr:Nif3-like dinuclear metal center hexameric protein [Bacteroidales bacterium]